MAGQGIRKGDKVRALDGSGPVMDVLAASDHWAICGWQDGTHGHEAVLDLRNLKKVAMQQQSQPQAGTTAQPGTPLPTQSPKG